MNSSTILVVDDSVADRTIAARLLANRSYGPVLLASNGVEALTIIEDCQPAIVVTDLQMPEMDGLQLVSEIRSRHPHLPCILITAVGSEELAAEAIRRGAASYVPKRRMAETLGNTVNQVLAAARNKNKQRRVDTYQIRREIEYNIPSDAGIVETLVARLQESISHRFVVDELELIQIGIALGEALRNAIDHGNLELDSSLKDSEDGQFERLAEHRRIHAPWCDRNVGVLVIETPAEIRFTIRDDGPGFDARNLDYDPTSPENLSKPHGRGLFLIREFMDDVAFNDRGNEITLIRKSRKQEDKLKSANPDAHHPAGAEPAYC